MFVVVGGRIDKRENGQNQPPPHHPHLRYAAGDFRYTVQDNVGAASVRVHAATDNVAGVRVPRFDVGTGGGGAAAGSPSRPAAATATTTTTTARTDLTGLGAGGQQVAAARTAFLSAARLLVDLASLQTAFVTLDAAIKTTNRRVNALDNVVRPRLEATIDYIKGELDELEREEFFRLKKVQAKKKRDAAAKAAAEGGVVGDADGAASGVPSAVGGRDEEIVF